MACSSYRPWSAADGPYIPQLRVTFARPASESNLSGSPAATYRRVGRVSAAAAPPSPAPLAPPLPRPPRPQPARYTDRVWRARSERSGTLVARAERGHRAAGARCRHRTCRGLNKAGRANACHAVVLCTDERSTNCRKAFVIVCSDVIL